MKRLITRGGVALCLALAFTIGCEDTKKPAEEPDEEQADKAKEGNEGAVKEDAPTPEPTGLSESEQAELKSETAAEVAKSITVENVDAEVAALEKALEAELAE